MTSASMARLLARTALLAGLAAGAACSLSEQTSAASDTPVPMLTTYAQMPVRVCVATDAVSLAALRDGRSRLVLHVLHPQVAAQYSPSFAVALVDTTTRRIELEPFSMHAERNANGEAPAAQHFGFNLAGRIPAGTVPGRLCVHVSVDLSDKGSESLGATQVSISASLESAGR